MTNADLTITFQDHTDRVHGRYHHPDDGTALDTYKEGEAIAVAGMDVVIKGEPQGRRWLHHRAQRRPFPPSRRWTAPLPPCATTANSDGSTAYGTLAHGITQSLTELDTALNRVSTVRGLAGDLLNQAERMGNTLLVREEQTEAQRVAAEQYDAEGMVRAICANADPANSSIGGAAVVRFDPEAVAVELYLLKILMKSGPERLLGQALAAIAFESLPCNTL